MPGTKRGEIENCTWNAPQDLSASTLSPNIVEPRFIWRQTQN